MKESIHYKFFYKSVFAALVVCFSLGITDIILIKYINPFIPINTINNIILTLTLRIPLIIIFSELFFYLYYFYSIKV